jgi:hypothetical protein
MPYEVELSPATSGSLNCHPAIHSCRPTKLCADARQAPNDIQLAAAAA